MVNDGAEPSTSFAAASEASGNGSGTGVSVDSNPVVSWGLSYVAKVSRMLCSAATIGVLLSWTPAAWVLSALSYFWVFTAPLWVAGTAAFWTGSEKEPAGVCDCCCGS